MNFINKICWWFTGVFQKFKKREINKGPITEIFKVICIVKPLSTKKAIYLKYNNLQFKHKKITHQTNPFLLKISYLCWAKKIKLTKKL